jgi:hypothetical protein
VAGFCEQADEPSCFIKCKEFDKLRNPSVFQEGFCSMELFIYLFIFELR